MRSDADAGWSWFDGGSGDGSGDGGAPADPALAIAFARCFGSADGRRVLSHLRALTRGRALAPAASDASLRHLERQRALVLYVEAMIARGSTAGTATRDVPPLDPLPGTALPGAPLPGAALYPEPPAGVPPSTNLPSADAAEP